LGESRFEHVSTKVLTDFEGANGSVGSLAVQLAALSGFTVIAVVSDRGDESATKARGATHVFKAGDPNLIARIQSEVGPIARAFDSVVSESTMLGVVQSLSDSGARKVATAIMYGGQATKSIEVSSVFSGELYGKNMSGEVSARGREVGRWLWTNASKWLESQALSPLDFEVIGGLEDIDAGLSRMRNGTIRHKQVVQISHQ
jgi:NADPH:quinone reductase-like Zn-dependent oxidoreductase